MKSEYDKLDSVRELQVLGLKAGLTLMERSFIGG